ncbi:helix-turn-helix domain-containing protein [Streptomonospora sp. S1-112]|uniref:Helix-turn-helix domain-containing protein n=2 Tax=Streptomonospora mangrovi TaxID=2883123 RepID=A0A9X3SK97_9ACTN|nr:helix-turn-helix domain-containing protein [Streptomonospora mangrovi]
MASELGFHRSTLYRWIYLGCGPKCFQSPGGHLRVWRSDFLEWCEHHNLSPEG